MEFIILLLIIFIIWPLLRGMWRLWQLRRAYRRAASGFSDIFGRAYRPGNSGGRDGFHPRPAPPRKKKKIDPSVGEYVAFEEIKESSAASSRPGDSDTTQIKAESQIEDAVWEEIRND